MHHASIGNATSSFAGEKIGFRRLEINRNCLGSFDDELPILFIAEEPAAQVGHLLDLPVDTAKCLSDICVERSLVVVKISELMNEKTKLRVHEPVIDQIGRRQTGRRNSREICSHVPIKLHFSIESSWTEIA